MKNVEQGLQRSAGRRLPMWIFLGAFACLGVGAFLILRTPARRESAHAQPDSANTDQSREIDRLKQAVTLLAHKSAALAVAVSSSQRDADLRLRDNEPPKAPADLKDTRSAAEIEQAEITDLEVRFTSEKDGSRDNLVAAQVMQAELHAAPLGAARVTEVACSKSLCRATLERDVSATQLDMTAVIESTPSVRRESMFSYDEEGSVKRVTIYSAREGHKLMPPAPNSATGATAR
ncbi:MAG TPA: hypothetical protein VER96_27770 [Polyangiaceae bacterium]|nr:hypothetical protein [Polyangiaceae bacterium]